jgi:predicted ATPase
VKVDALFIRSRFKNLNEVKIDFDEHNLMTVIVGRNGSGKSNVIEALVAIFRNLDLGESPPFSYLIRYKLGEGLTTRWITIDADPNRGALSKQYEAYFRSTLEIEGNELGEPIPFARLKRDRNGHAEFLPKYVFAYYSGPSDRLERYFRKHRTDFYKKLLNSKVDLRGDIRPLFYAKPFHSQFVLLAFFLAEHDDDERKFLREHLGIEGLDSVHFVMRKPDWVRRKFRDERFWGAEGVVRDFLDALYPLALAPIQITRTEDTSLTGTRIRNEFVHLFLPDAQRLRQFANGLSPDVFFKMLESTLLSEIISEVSVRVKVSSSNEPLTFRELSEGEQQLLTVLGLLKFTGGADSLFLLDEPDTHLNPAWAVKYLAFLRQFVPNHTTSHILMVTHHPLAIAELQKEQVQVMWRDVTSQVHAQEPEESPRGLGYAGILTSDMFGLSTTLDLPTEELIRSRRAIVEKETLLPDDEEALREIDRKLSHLGFSASHWDKDYSEYLRERRAVEENLFEGAAVSPEVQSKRRQVARKVIEKLLSEETDEEAGLAKD